ncbi:MAG: histidine kinase dimerization/phospho-acceptor domain-containing protein [Chloroflexota bacterium]
MKTELEKLQAENAQLRAERDKAIKFIGLLHHELRAPLASLQGYSELLKNFESENLKTMQLSHLDAIQAGLSHFRSTFNSSMLVAQFGFYRRDHKDLVNLAEFERKILRPSLDYLGDEVDITLDLEEDFSIQPALYALDIQKEALVEIVAGVLREVKAFYTSGIVNVKLGVKDKKLKLALLFPDTLKSLSSPQSFRRNQYERGYIDWAAKEVIELYEGDMESRLVDGIIHIEIQIPITPTKITNE